jgi:cephalosporin-C deacetylase-like acetyl esterase
VPTVCGEHTARAVKGALAWRSPASVKNKRRGIIPGGGHEGSAIQRPGNVSWWLAGFTLSVIQARSIGSSITPVSTALSQ